ncbi:LNS2-domain-containing protein [Choiromyces venosus 120613-1]|uniref:LNS2-domain-containing protein n=1 Tax=Choiromyces venosus 120613-1 TaxID=1336337 RepID=A0A3N4JGZ9_9PEZI|nr:LNS2-domain-containing protein [Choiromyces venosus 120613-1]
MQYVRSISGSVSKTWNSINPATLSGAIDVIVVEQENGDLACSPFHVRFGKFSLLRPYEKKVVEFRVNGQKTDYSMKLGEGGEAFFIFETNQIVPPEMQTSPLVSPSASPRSMASVPEPSSLQEPDYLNIADTSGRKAESTGDLLLSPRRAQSDFGNATPLSSSPPDNARPASGDWSGAAISLERSASAEVLPTSTRRYTMSGQGGPVRTRSPPPIDHAAAVERALALSRKLSVSNIPTHITDRGDVMLDMHGYKLDQEESLQAEMIARKILAEELEGDYDIGSLIGADRNGNLWIYSSEEAKEKAGREEGISQGIDAVSDAGYSSDEARSDSSSESAKKRIDRLSTPPTTPPLPGQEQSESKSYAKTLRLTSEQLKSLDLKPGANAISFSVNKATCTAFMYLWKSDVPIVISDIDGTITKSDALGHVLTMIGRDWTHLGVAKLYTDIAANGYHLLYLTSRSVGQADTTRNYLNGIVQDKYKLPKGPVIMSPDRTFSALRREVYLRKPEVFKMACLRDILNLFGARHNPFYAGFGNRLTDALSYRSVNIPSTRIFTINSYAEVSLDLLTLTKYKSSYVNMRDLVDHFFPPVGLLSTDEQYTDFNYWRDPVPDPEEFSDSEDEEAGEDDEDEDGEMGDSYYEEHGEMAEGYMENADGEDEYDEDEEEDEDGEEEEEGEYDEESEMAESKIEQHPTEVQKENEGLKEAAKAEEITESKIPFVGGKVSGMKIDLDTSRLTQAEEFAEKELSGIVNEVVGEIKALTTDSKKPEVENRSYEEIGVSA